MTTLQTSTHSNFQQGIITFGFNRNTLHILRACPDSNKDIKWSLIGLFQPFTVAQMVTQLDHSQPTPIETSSIITGRGLEQAQRAPTGAAILFEELFALLH